MAVNHYENFPVASLLLPAPLRAPVRAIYGFARSADDLADEGDATPEQRLAALAAHGAQLERMAQRGASQAPMWAALQQAVRQWQLPLQPFRDLLSAFRQDVVTIRYPDYAALRDYCARSADPVGTLMLHLYGVPTPDNLQASNAICSALQLINFLQDVAIDWKKGRIYLPQDALARFGVTEGHVAEARIDDAWRAYMYFEVARTRALMMSGASLALRLPGRIGWELRLVVQGGLRILTRIETAGFDVFNHRPVLGPCDWLAMGVAALRMRGRQPH